MLVQQNNDYVSNGEQASALQGASRRRLRRESKRARNKNQTFMSLKEVSDTMRRSSSRHD